jgi:predicted dithiol-disulfide oxidoreductase (DUF899 family)
MNDAQSLPPAAEPDFFRVNDAQTLTAAAELAFKASRPYPGDSLEYRKARTALLAEEIELRRHIERVAAMRRGLPPGGEAPDYHFTDEHGRELGLADLFGRHDTLMSYF